MTAVVYSIFTKSPVKRRTFRGNRKPARGGADMDGAMAALSRALGLTSELQGIAEQSGIRVLQAAVNELARELLFVERQIERQVAREG